MSMKLSVSIVHRCIDRRGKYTDNSSGLARTEWLFPSNVWEDGRVWVGFGRVSVERRVVGVAKSKADGARISVKLLR
jgi:hypothetical protein